MVKYKVILLTILVLLITGCGGVVTASDPGYAAVDAYATLAKAQYLQNGQNATATMQAVSTQKVAEGEAALIVAHLQETQTSLEVAKFEATGVAEQHATSTAIAGAYATATVYIPTATQAAILENRKNQEETVTHYAGLATRAVVPVGLLSIFVALIIVTVGSAPKLIKYIAELLKVLIIRFSTIRYKDREVVFQKTEHGIVLFDVGRAPGAGAIINADTGLIEITGIGNDSQIASDTIMRDQLPRILQSLPQGTPMPELGNIVASQPAIQDVKPNIIWIDEVEQKMLEG